MTGHGTGAVIFVYKRMEHIMNRATALLIVMLLPCALNAQYSSVNSHAILNGSSYISVPYHFDLNEGLTSQEEMSIDAWVMPTATGSIMTIVGNDLKSGYWFGLHSNGRLRFYPNPGASYDSKSTVSTGVWTHVAVHFDEENSRVRFYINGTLDQTHSLPQAYLGYAYGDLRIGADRSGSSAAYFWRGRLDEVRIWKQRIDFSTAMGDLYRIPHVVAGGLYGYALEAAWRLNGNAADPVGSHNGSHVGSVSYAASPDANFYDRIGVRFQNAAGIANVVDHFEIPFGKGLELRNSYTIEFWVKPSSTGGHNQYQTLFCKEVSSPVAAIYPVWLGINKSNGKLRFVPNGDMQNYFESTAALPVSKWSHVAARFQGAAGSYTATLYIDGLPKGEKKYTAMGPSNSSGILLGASAKTFQSNYVYGFNGLIDELRIWTTNRTDLEIADSYRREFNGPVSHLEAVYRFDGDVIDHSGNGHHGRNTYGYAMFYFYRTTDLPSEPSLTLTAPGDGATWVIGDPVTVKWNATGLHYVTVDLSRDGGTTWTEILYNAGAASAGAVNWTVTGPASGDAHVRVRTPTPTGIEDRATKITIREPVPMMQVQPPAISMVVSRNAPLPPPVPVIIANIGGSTLSWNGVLASGATWLALQPDQGTANLDTFMVQLTTTDLNVGQYTERIVLEGNAANHGLEIPVTLTVTAQRVYSVAGTIRAPTGAPMEFIPVEATGERYAVTESDRDGKYLLDFLPSGDYRVAPTSFYFESTPTERKYTPLNNYEAGADFTMRPRTGRLLLRYHEGWNLIAIPLLPDVSDLQLLLPDAIPPAYAWDPDSGYVRRWTVQGCTAYWVKFTKRDSIMIAGQLVRDLTVPYSSAQTGWNLFAGPSGPCPVAEIAQAPSGILLSAYAYDPYYGYLPPVDGLIEAGKGYFVKIGAAGNLFLRAHESVGSSPARTMLRFPGVARPDDE